jgi:hypothetical protein
MASLEKAFTPPAVMMFNNLFAPRQNQDGSLGKYDILMVVKPKEQKSPYWVDLVNKIKAAAALTHPKLPLSKLTLPIQKPDALLEKGYDGVEEGDMIIKAASKEKPGIVDRNAQDIINKSEVWSGQIVRAEVAVGGYDVNGKKGVTLYLDNVQVLKSNMPRLDGRKSASATFAAAPPVTGYDEDDSDDNTALEDTLSTPAPAPAKAAKAKGKSAVATVTDNDDLFG